MTFAVWRLIEKAPHSFLAAVLCFLAACAPNADNETQLMPSPAIYTVAKFDPFSKNAPKNILERTKLFYATDRMPAGSSDRRPFYTYQRGHVLRVGVARVETDPPLNSWNDIRRKTLGDKQGEAHTLRVSRVEEIGAMPFGLTEYFEDPPSQEEMDAVGRSFAAQIESHLSDSGKKEIFIFIHGYNVDFSYSTLVAKELQHFLGYQGAFISYNWTATPNRFAYFRDQESALATRRNLRSLVEYLSENTSAHRIHLVGHSVGSRLAFEAVYQIALQPDPKPRIGRLVLIASELDRAVFLQAIEDNLLDAIGDLTVYQTQTDAALSMSRLVYGRERLGQAPGEGAVRPAVQARLVEISDLHIIDATDAEKAGAGNGHSYFRSSPWVSSDLFLALMTDRDPRARGLVRASGEAVWRFPSNYPTVLKSIASGG